MDDVLPLLVRYGYAIVFVGAILEGETVVVLAGVLVHQAVLGYPGAVLVSAAGAVAGDQVWFHVGRHLGPSLWPRFPRLARRVDSIGPWIDERSDWIAAASRFTYGTRIASPLLLGAHGYAVARFMAINTVTGVAWALLGVTAGYLLGTGGEELLGGMARLEWLALVAVIAVLGWRRLRRPRRPANPCT